MTTHSKKEAPLYTSENYNPEESIGRLIADVSGRLLVAFDDEMTGMGITGAQWVILMGGCKRWKPGRAARCWPASGLKSPSRVPLHPA